MTPHGPPRLRSNPVARLSALGGALAVTLAPAASFGGSLPLELEAGECPSEALIRAQLEPLLGDPAAHTPQGAPLAAGQRARVRDLGRRYSIEIGSARRQAEDPARDCLERARVAAVFIALNLREAPAEAPPVQRPPSAPASPAPAPPPEPAPAGVRLGGHVFIQAASAPERSLVTTGPGLGLSFRRRGWGADLSAGVLAPVEVELDPGPQSAGAVSILRFPIALTAMPSWRAGALELGPRAGLAVDILSFRGERLEQPRAAVRVSPGALAGVEARWLLSQNWWAFANVAAAAFPLEYRLRVEPTGTLGTAPKTWLGLALGVGKSGPHRERRPVGAP